MKGGRTVPSSAEASIIIANVLFIVIICVCALIISRALQWPLRKHLSSEAGRKVGGTIFINIIRVGVWGWAISIILNVVFGIDIASMLGALGIVGIAVSLGAQQTIANVIGGVIVSLSKMVGPGDWITVDGHKEARVIDTDWRRTVLENEDGVQYAVPNSLLVSNLVEKGNAYAMIVAPFAFKQNVDDVEKFLAEVEDVLLARQIETGHDFEQMRPKAHVQGIGLGVIQAEVKIYTDRVADSRVIKRAVLPALVDLLQERKLMPEVYRPDTAA